MISDQPDPSLNQEAIPAQQPLAASPGPEQERKPRSGWRSGWLFLLLLLVVLVLLGGLYRRTPARGADRPREREMPTGRSRTDTGPGSQ